jgi:hypothetical protein
MARDWEEYGKGPRSHRGDKFYASLNWRGDIVFNNLLYEGLGKPTHVVLLLERRTGTIGLRPVEPDAENAFRVRRNGRGTSRLVHCSSFLNEKGIKTERTTSFPTARIEHNVLLLELKYRVPATVNRKKSGKA